MSKTGHVKIHVFVSIDMPDHAADAVQAVQRALQADGLFDCRLTRPENLHLTLKFLGDDLCALQRRVDQELADLYKA